MNILITGVCGSIGSEACIYFAKKGYKIFGIDNFLRKKVFGEDGNTEEILPLLKKYLSKFENIDIREKNNKELISLIKNSDVIIHTAAQPSHPKSIDIPILDMSINVVGTVNLLELVRTFNKECLFLFTSTNKVYGENPNKLEIVELEKRYDYKHFYGVDENMSLDKTKHTPFGVSKAACDLYVQEYFKTYGIKTGIFRLGCITGSGAKAVELHNWEPYFVRKNLLKENLTIYGFGGKQVRDVIHTYDFVRLLNKFINNPICGEVFNVGGGRKNSISMLEAIELIESITKIKMKYTFGEKREGDHQVYITDMSKVYKHFPNYDLNYNLIDIFTELYYKQRELMC